jgi:4-amino-4-deoxy-L-arabinose transferase-like glycosyltransferase
MGAAITLIFMTPPVRGILPPFMAIFLLLLVAVRRVDRSMGDILLF